MIKVLSLIVVGFNLLYILCINVCYVFVLIEMEIIFIFYFNFIFRWIDVENNVLK